MSNVLDFASSKSIAEVAVNIESAYIKGCLADSVQTIEPMISSVLSRVSLSLIYLDFAFFSSALGPLNLIG